MDWIPQYERNDARVSSPQVSFMKGKRQSTVEPVFGTLTQFMGLRIINIGIGQANKVMHLAAIAYNIKKYLNYNQKRVKSGAARLAYIQSIKSALQYFLGTTAKHKKYALQYCPIKKKAS